MLKIPNSLFHPEETKTDQNINLQIQVYKRHIEFVHEGIKEFKCNICEYKA